jgi:hypothetical protein
MGARTRLDPVGKRKICCLFQASNLQVLGRPCRPSRSLVTIHSDILIMKANEMHYFSNLFDKILYMFRTSHLSSSGESQNCIHVIHASSVGIC